MDRPDDVPLEIEETKEISDSHGPPKRDPGEPEAVRSSASAPLLETKRPVTSKPLVVIRPTDSFGGRVQIRCLWPSKVIKVGEVTGERLVFEGGQPVWVDHRDAQPLKEKRRSPGCCGGRTNDRFFEEV